MTRCLLSLNGANYDVTNLLSEESLCDFLAGLTMVEDHVQHKRERRPSWRHMKDWSSPLYPNLRDPCNKRLLQDCEMPLWESVPLEKEPTNEQAADKYAEFYELQQRDMQRLQDQHQQQLHVDADLDFPATASITRAQTAPLHSLAPAASSTACSLPQFAHQTTMCARPRQSLPPVRRNPPQRNPPHPHRHSTTAIPGDIESSSSGLRPRVNYKALYSRNRNISSNSASSCESVYEEDETLGCSSSRQCQYDDAPEDNPVQEDESPAEPTTMEIAPNVRVAVRSSQESYKAVQSGDYTVATCFACAATIVCVNDAAYVLCPDCQVVSPLGFGAATHDASKKDDPYGIGTGLKREWVNEWVGSI